MSDPPPAPPLPSPTSNAQTIARGYGALTPGSPDAEERLAELVYHHSAYVHGHRRPNPEPSADERSLLDAMLDALIAIPCKENTAELACGLLENVFRYLYSLQTYADETSPFVSLRDPVRVVRHAKHLPTLRSLHLQTNYNIVRSSRSSCVIQAPESPTTATVANSLLRLASGYATVRKPLPALEQVAGPLFPKLWTFVLQALPRTPVPVLKLVLSTVPLPTVAKPPELVSAVAAAFGRACETASAPAIAAAADALSSLLTSDDPETAEIFARFGSMGFLLLPTERDVNSSHTRFPNVVGRFVVRLTPAPGLTLHHVVRAGDSDAITTTLRPDRPLQFSFYARTTPAPGYIPVSTRTSSIRIDHPDDRVRGRGDFTMYVPLDKATATAARPPIEGVRPQQALQAAVLLLKQAKASEPNDAVLQGLRSALKLLLFLWRDAELPCDGGEIAEMLDEASQYLFGSLHDMKVSPTRLPLFGLPSTLTNNSFRCGTTRRCENGEQCSSCALMQVPEISIFMAMEPLADLCMHALSTMATPGLFRATARCYSVLEEDPQNDMAAVCGSLRRMALPGTQDLLASMFTEALVSQLSKKTGSGPTGYVLRSNFFIGARVCRSDHWHYDNQDGGPGNIGVIIARDSENWVRVRWVSNNSDNVYEIENEGNSTLYFADTRPDWFIVRHLGQIVRLTSASNPSNQNGDNFESLVPMVIAATAPGFTKALKADIRDTLTAVDGALSTVRMCWQAVRVSEVNGEATPLPVALQEACEQKIVELLTTHGVKDQISSSVQELALKWAATKDASNVPSEHPAFKVSLTQDNTDPLCRRIHGWLRAQWEHGAAQAARIMCESHKDDLSGVLVLLCDFIEAFRPGKSPMSNELKGMVLNLWAARFKGRTVDEAVVDQVAHFGLLALRALATCWPEGGFELLSRRMSEAGADAGDLRTFFEVRRPQIHGGDDIVRLIGTEFTKMIFSRMSNLPQARIATMVQEMMARLLKLASDAQEPVDMRVIISDLPWARVVIAISEGDGLEQAVGSVVIESLPEDLFMSSFAPLASRVLSFLQSNLQTFLPAFSRAVELGVAPDPKATQSREVLDFLKAASSLQRVSIPSLLERFFRIFADIVRAFLLDAVLAAGLKVGLDHLTVAVEVLGLLSWNSMALKQISTRALRCFVEGENFREWLSDALSTELQVFSATRQNASLASVGLLLRATVNWERGFGSSLSLSPVITETLSNLISADVKRLVMNTHHVASHIVDGLSALRECWLACVDTGFGAHFLREELLPLADDFDEPDNAKASHWFRSVTSLCVRAQPSPESAVIGELSSNIVFQVSDETAMDGLVVWRCKLGWVGPLLGVAEPRGSEKTPAPTVTPLRSSTASPRRQPGAAAAEQWTCPACTCHNPVEAMACQACGSVRSQSWTCSACTYINEDPSRFSCEICQTHRPPTTVEAESAEEAQPRGKCMNGSCPTREFGACGAFIPIRGENKCSYCGCADEEHKVELAERDLFLRRAARQCYPTGLEILRPLRVVLMQRLIEGAQSPADTSAHQGLVGLLAIFLTEQLDVLNTTVSMDMLRQTLQRAATLAAMLSPMARRSLQTLLLEGTSTRLLRNRSRCVEAEYVFASVFRPVFGQMFDGQVKAMLDESSWSTILSRQFALASPPSKFEFGAVVASRHNWAFASIFEVSWTPPEQLRACLENFSAYQHEGRHLQLRFPEPSRDVRIHVHFARAAQVQDHTVCMACKTALGHALDCVTRSVENTLQLEVSTALPVALLAQSLLAGLTVSTHTAIQLFQNGRFLLNGSEPVGKLSAEPIVAVVAHRPVKVLTRVKPEMLQPTAINAPQFYLRHAATTLTWLPRGQGELLWTRKKANLSVSTVQMCVLLAFNEADTLSYGQLLAMTGLADSVLEAELLALCTAPHDVLTTTRRRRRETSFSDSDLFSINEAFAGTGNVFVRSTAFAVARQDVTRSAVSLHGNCIDRLDATIMRLLKHSPTGVTVGRLTADVAKECRSQFIVAPEHVSERLRRLAADGLVQLEADKVIFVPDNKETGVVPMALEGGLSRSVSLDNRGQPDGLVRLDSVTDEPPSIMRVQSVDLAAAAKHELSVLLPTFTLDVASDLAVLGLSAPGPVFCTRDAMLRGLYSTIDRLSDCLSISKSHALYYLSIRDVRWDMRAAIDYHYSKAQPKRQPNAVCGFSLSYACEENPLEETFPACGHSFHRDCLRSYLVEHCFGNFSGCAVRGETAIAGTTCPMPDETSNGAPACKSFIPWLELLDSDFFGTDTAEARKRFEDDVLTQWAAESPLLQACPGGCGMFAAVSAPPEQSVTIAQCTRCKTSFCFKCKGRWFEDHRPALCDHMTRWGDSIFSGESTAADLGAEKDATLLDQIYMFNNTVRCPRCKVRVQKSSGCQHLTCGASAYRGTDWRGRGCGLDFCEVCETPLSESNCESSTCRRPEKRARLEEERNRNRAARDQFQKVYIPRAQRETLRAAVADAHAKVDGADQLEAAAEVYIECLLARAHSIVTATLEPTVGLDEQTKRIAIKNLEDVIAQLQKTLVTYLPLRHLGPPQRGSVTLHEHDLVHKTRQVGCGKCGRDAPAGFSCPQDDGFEICVSCFFDHFQPPREPVRGELADRARTVLETFFRAFA